jgi:hypothetical protein
MLKSLMLTVACAYSNPPGLQPNAPTVQASIPEILKQAYAMQPGTQKKVAIDHGDGLCSRLVIEPSTDAALAAFVDRDAAKNFWSQPADCSRPSPEADEACNRAERMVGLPGSDEDYARYQVSHD